MHLSIVYLLAFDAAKLRDFVFCEMDKCRQAYENKYKFHRILRFVPHFLLAFIFVLCALGVCTAPQSDSTKFNSLVHTADFDCRKIVSSFQSVLLLIDIFNLQAKMLSAFEIEMHFK